MTKYLSYVTYKNDKTHGYDFLIGVSYYDAYIKADPDNSDITDIVLIYHEDDPSWQQGLSREVKLSKDKMYRLRQSIKNFYNEVAEPIDPEYLETASAYKAPTDNDYWINEIENILQIK
ncbi:MAG TPA: hypothetical protein H9820_10950 [Candidatus Companilactobacillus pullicola]|uniref:Uncharacterized protein n=1 Tax=Candidatus Companilactobacillus pullicola TaxID=2838523 RepID=A0A9D1ZPC0_9LACO|nr:hypothetical protein [Candidatus Companilactobacillus pullicola]